MTALIAYEAALRALAEAWRVDEVKNIRDKMTAMQAYARQAKDSEMMDRATDIRLRAERRAGGLLAEMAGRHERQGQGRQSKGNPELPLRLVDLDVTKMQSSRWQKLARLTTRHSSNGSPRQGARRLLLSN